MNTREDRACAELKAIFSAALERVSPYRMIKQQVHRNKDNLTFFSGEKETGIDLKKYQKIYIIGVGKAAAPMARGMEEILGEKLTGGRVVVKYGHTERLKKTIILEAGHPVPDTRSLKAANAISELCRKGDEKTLFLNLISGGGSALLTAPVRIQGFPPLTLGDIKKLTTLLLKCGAPIEEINCIRKHLSGVKGGRLAQQIFPAHWINLFLSDVVDDNLETIASGITSPDSTTYQQAWQIIKNYRIEEKIPPAVKLILLAGMEGKIDETPSTEDPVFQNGVNILLGTNKAAREAAGARSRALGFTAIIHNQAITGEAAKAGVFFAELSKQLKEKSPVCFIAGGETTVTVTGDGKGGRNQEMALAFLREIEKAPGDFKGVTFLSGATDGNDGPTDSAGAFASLGVLEKGKKKKLDIERYLDRNDSYHYFKKTGFHLKTGPTNTNVCDIQLLMVTRF